jgi:plasmid stabilization system protein ParE
LTLPVRFTAAARADLAEAAEWCFKRRRSLAGGFLDAVDKTAASIAEKPESYQIVFENLRRANSPRPWPFSLWYRVLPNGAIVVAALHHRRDRRRLSGRRAD